VQGRATPTDSRYLLDDAEDPAIADRRLLGGAAPAPDLPLAALSWSTAHTPTASLPWPTAHTPTSESTLRPGAGGAAQAAASAFGVAGAGSAAEYVLYANPVCPYAHRASAVAKLRLLPTQFEWAWIPLNLEVGLHCGPAPTHLVSCTSERKHANTTSHSHTRAIIAVGGWQPSYCEYSDSPTVLLL
jgi:hypothetical protein